MFCSSCVKSLKTPMNTKNSRSGDSEDLEGKALQESTDNGAGQKFSTASAETFKSGDQTQSQSMDTGDKTIEQFARARAKEVCGLIDNETFRIVDGASIPAVTRIFGSRFVYLLKNANKGSRYKSRQVAQNYVDEQSASIATKTRTVQRFTR